MGGADKQRITVALVGNPNVGKSTLFNALTGLHQHTGNWPGKTVSVVQGKVNHAGTEISLVDLPGTYSLDGTSEDERIAGEFAREGDLHCIVAVCDGSCLERSLILALQVLALGRPAVVCVNLMDEAKARGIRIDREKLEQLLGVPVVFTAAGKKQGLDLLLEKIVEAASQQRTPVSMFSSDPIGSAQSVAEACVRTDKDGSQGWRQALDRFLTSRRHGIPVMLVLLLAVIWLTVWGANYPSALLEKGFDWLYTLFSRISIGMDPWIRGILLDGVYATTARVISVMLPPMAIFFPLFTLLEDVGYLPRVAFLLDHSMSRCGGCGKQALTMCMGLGCNAVGVMGCRIIDSPRERLAAILTNAMVPCNGRFPTLILLGSLFFPEAPAALLVAACVALGMVGAMAVSGVLSKTALRGEQSTFVMEMPPFRRPRLDKILVQSLLERTVQVAARAIKVAAPMGAVLWILGRIGIMEELAALLDPVGMFLGMNGLLLLGFILSIPANELLIPVILMVMTGADSIVAVGGMSAALLPDGGITWKMAVCTMVFTLFHWPCATTLLTVHKETGSIKKTAAALILPTAVGCILCVMLRLVLG